MHSSPPDPRRWKALALLCAAFFMVILDTAIVLVALPSIETDLDFSSANLQWVLSAYALAFGSLLLLGGRAADLLGRRRTFIFGVGLFTLASLLCALATSPAMLIGTRAVQGAAAAAMTPSAMSIVTTTFGEGAERNKALGAWGAVGAIGGSAGWLIGGPLTDVGWEWIFLINLPIGLAALLLAPRLLQESRGVGGRISFDLPGAIAVTAALVLLVLAVVQAPEAGWESGQTIGLLVGSAVLFGAFALVEARVVAPLLPFHILRSRARVGANVTMFLFSMISFGSPFVLTLYAQQVLGYSPSEFGLTSLVMPVGAAAGAVVGQRLILRFGFRSVAVAGLTLIALGSLFLAQVPPDGGYLRDILPGLMLTGPGFGLTFVTCSIAALAGVDEHEAGLASGISNTMFQIGGAVGTAIVSTIAVSVSDDFFASNPGADRLGGLTDGFQAGFIACAVVSALGLVAAFALLGRRSGRSSRSDSDA